VKFALAIISINIVNVGRPSISHNDWRIPEVPTGGTILWYRYWWGRNLGEGRQAENRESVSYASALAPQ
jgi:hypothetical protein